VHHPLCSRSFIGEDVVIAQQGEITALLRDWSAGKRSGEEQLFQLVYPQLRSIATALFRRERQESLLQPTSVVNELFLRLVTLRQLEFQDRQHFYGFAARVMRRVLVDHARAENTLKRDRGISVAFDDSLAWVDVSLEEALDLDRALTDLEALDKRKCQMLELRFLLGFTADETAQLMQLSKASVDRDLRFVRGWLQDRLQTSHE
jgi:RNA polymerase sigma factor (TIGR02999 family)